MEYEIFQDRYDSQSRVSTRFEIKHLIKYIRLIAKGSWVFKYKDAYFNGKKITSILYLMVDNNEKSQKEKN